MPNLGYARLMTNTDTTAPEFDADDLTDEAWAEYDAWFARGHDW